MPAVLTAAERANAPSRHAARARAAACCNLPPSSKLQDAVISQGSRSMPARTRPAAPKRTVHDPMEDTMTAKSTKDTAAKTPAGTDLTTADEAKNVTTAADVEAGKSGDRDDVVDGQQVQERNDIGAAAEPDGPDTVKLITEVRPGLAN